MVDIQSKEVIDKISEELKVQPSMQIPRELAKQIQLIYNINPERKIQIKVADASDSTFANIMTTHAKKRTFLIGVYLTVSKDVLNDSLFSSITVIPKKGAQVTIISIRYEPLTAGQFTESIMFPVPIELEKSSGIGISNTTATASIDTGGRIFFYEEDPL